MPGRKNDPPRGASTPANRRPASRPRETRSTAWRDETVAFVARLASHPTLDDVVRAVSPGSGADVERLNRKILLREFQRLWLREEGRRATTGLPGPTWHELEKLHAFTQRALVPLVDGKRPEVGEHLAALAGGRARWNVLVRDRTVTVESEAAPALRGLLGAVWLFAVPGGSAGFPFARCEWCRRVFVPEKNQRFHSADCQREANREKRRLYMRELMRRRRAETRRPEGT